MRMNLQRKGTEQNINFWFGSAIHFALEDFFGHNRFGGLDRAFQAYYAAFKPHDRPEGADVHYFLGLGMLDYFKSWYSKHNEAYGFQTVWLDENKQVVEPGTPGARPLVEESFLLDLGKKVWIREDTEQIITPESAVIGFDPDEKRHYIHGSGDAFNVWDDLAKATRVYVREVPIMYHGTMDRIVQDKLGRWWIMDWKTAKGADTNKLDTDDQISAYLWAAEQWFGRPIYGFVYVQLTKELPKPPKRIGSGSLSVDKKQKTTHALLKAEIVKDYGDVRKAPAKIIDFLNHLAAEETPEGDRFVRWDLVTRNHAQKVSTYHHIMGEVELQTNPDLYLFPNPTRDCIWDCPFRNACIMTDRGEVEAVKQWIEENFEQRPREEDGNIDEWRKNIPWPDTNQGDAIGTLIASMGTSAEDMFDIILPEKYRDAD
jgi:hypothetical protein